MPITIGSFNFVLQSIEKIPGVGVVVEVADNKFEIDSTEEDIREQVFKFAVKNELMVLSMQQVGKGMEEVFQQLTRG